MSLRTDQLGTVIQHAVQQVLTRGVNDPRVRGLVSVTRVQVIPDLSEARVFISVLPEEHAPLSLHGLQHASGYIQRKIANEIEAKRLPRLVFKLDEKLRKAAVFEAALARARTTTPDQEAEQEFAIHPEENHSC